ncbi:MAG: hypothetical protein ACJ786_00125 [Catenulispora sp.]
MASARVDVEGGHGGDVPASPLGAGGGGSGGKATATLAVSSANTYSIYAGGKGGDETSGFRAAPATGGFSNGGAGGVGAVAGGGAGGGSSEVQLGQTRLVVAGGGGGAAITSTGIISGGNGGGTTGSPGGSSDATGGHGATDTAPGGAGTGAVGGADGTAGAGSSGGAGGNAFNSGAGGGGGFFGGGGGGGGGISNQGSPAGAGGGGGGSGHLDTTTGSVSNGDMSTPSARTGDGIVTLTYTVPNADLQVTKTDNKTSAVPGTTDTYTITVTNGSQTTAVAGATVADAFPSTLTNVAYTATQTGGATGFTSSGTGAINDTVTMGAGSTITYSATGTIAPSATGTLSNTATVTAPSGIVDPDLSNNTAGDTDTLTPQADLAVTKTGPASAAPNSNIIYSVVVSNAGPSVAASAALTDVLPTGTTLVSVTPPSGWACPSPPSVAPLANGTVICSTTAPFDVTPQNSPGSTFTIVVRVTPSASGQVSNQASVSSPSDSNTANDTSTALNTTVGCTQTITGTSAPLRITRGTTCVRGATITGNLIVGRGASLVLVGSVVQGRVTASSPGAITICATDVRSGVRVMRATGFVLIGDPGDDGCAGNTIGGSLTLTKNQGGLEVSHNQKLDNVTLIGNVGTGPFPDDAVPEVEANSITGALVCTGNNPAPTNSGLPNTVAGGRTGQCGAAGF